MAADERTAGGAVIEQLLEHPNRFNLFQAISLLERVHQATAQYGGACAAVEVQAQAVRLNAHISLAFEPSDVRSVTLPQVDGAPYTLVTGAFGLTGGPGGLPAPYVERLLELRARRNFASTEFLDIFNHRFLTFLYRSRRKHQVALSPATAHQAMLPSVLNAVSALGAVPVERARDGVKGPVAAVPGLQHAGLFSGAPRCAVGLAALLHDVLGSPVQVLQFQGGWSSLEPQESSRLNGRLRLGQAAVVGREVWEQGAGVCLVFAPMPRARFLALLPGGADHMQLKSLVRHYLRQELNVAIQLQMDSAQVPECRLGRDQAVRLGWNAWLGGCSAGAQRKYAVRLQLR